MKYLNQLLDLGCFSRHDVVGLTGGEAAAHSLLHDYAKKGYIERIKRDLYTAISLETKQPVASRFAIASHLADDACVSHHSAFEYYGYANQVFYEVTVTTKSRFTNFVFDGVTYCHITSPINVGVEKFAAGINVTSLERTVIDSIKDFTKIGGLEELLRCIALIPALHADKLAACLDAYGQGYLYQKAGYLLAHYAEQLGLAASFFDHCRSKISKSKKYLYTDQDAWFDSFIWHEQWRLYAPAALNKIINKGVDIDA